MGTGLYSIIVGFFPSSQFQPTLVYYSAFVRCKVTHIFIVNTLLLYSNKHILLNYHNITRTYSEWVSFSGSGLYVMQQASTYFRPMLLFLFLCVCMQNLTPLRNKWSPSRQVYSWMEASKIKVGSIFLYNEALSLLLCVM